MGFQMNLQTDRLKLRPSKLIDVPALFEFMGDREAMKFTQVEASMRTCRRRVAVHEWFRRRNGYAPWTVVNKSDNRIIGWGGLYDDPFDPDWGVEVGYFFHPSVWGQGLATELVCSSLELADNNLRLPMVSAFAHRENAGSRRVLEKNGFQVVKFVPEMERLLFKRVAP